MSSFKWFDWKGYGYYPVSDGPKVYDQAYFDKYVGYSMTPLGVEIDRFRQAFASAFVGNAPLIDVGIGCGSFIEKRGHGAMGYDIAEPMVEWLHSKGLYKNPYTSHPRVVTCWDSLEHLAAPSMLIERVREWLITSIPIFENRDHCLTSRHFRTDEHFWYFTLHGLCRFMSEFGFETRAVSWKETELGRESIASFAFQRRDHR